jgi:glutamate/tyrosine decarboxylase-like PLP-dependent enzyme
VSAFLFLRSAGSAGTVQLLDEYETCTGHSVQIHVDGTSSGFIVPFAHPKPQWCFKLPGVVSMNTSAHKFGLPQRGVGWVVWRNNGLWRKHWHIELRILDSYRTSKQPGSCRVVLELRGLTLSRRATRAIRWIAANISTTDLLRWNPEVNVTSCTNI